ncbi:cytochrome P450 709B2-like [Miscanthus floridulus]|uniref:cytochrome P450 709B2-like n=1 Tax=Miscanthus floridulus TaxID=154761 RepID=UPI00345972EA
MVEMSGSGVGVVLAAFAAALVPLLWAALVRQVWRPYALARAFARQGVRGPPYRFYVGNNPEARAMLAAAASGEALERSSNDIVPRVMPHVRAWASLYGKVFLSWTGSTPRLWAGDIDMAKRILSDKAGLYVKPDPGSALLALLGMDLAFTEGDDWACHRRVVHPAFAMDRLKSMTAAMAACAAEVVRDWEARAAAASASGEATVEVGRRFTEHTADVISHTAFGSSYRQGKEVFLAQRELQLMVFTSINNVVVHVPGMEYVSTKANVRRWQLERTVRSTLMAIIDERLALAKKSKGYGTEI